MARCGASFDGSFPAKACTSPNEAIARIGATQARANQVLPNPAITILFSRNWPRTVASTAFLAPTWAHHKRLRHACRTALFAQWSRPIAGQAEATWQAKLKQG